MVRILATFLRTSFTLDALCAAKRKAKILVAFVEVFLEVRFNEERFKIQASM